MLTWILLYVIYTVIIEKQTNKQKEYVGKAGIPPNYLFKKCRFLKRGHNFKITENLTEVEVTLNINKTYFNF